MKMKRSNLVKIYRDVQVGGKKFFTGQNVRFGTAVVLLLTGKGLIITSKNMTPRLKNVIKGIHKNDKGDIKKIGLLSNTGELLYILGTVQIINTYMNWLRYLRHEELKKNRKKLIKDIVKEVNKKRSTNKSLNPKLNSTHKKGLGKGSSIKKVRGAIKK
jgi:hypothetical protein